MRGGVLTRGAAPPVPAAEARRSARKYIPVPGSAPAAGTSAGTPGGCRAEGVRIAPPATSVDWTSVPGRIPARLCRSKASRIPGSPDGRPVPSGTEDDRAPAPEGAGCSRKTSVRGSTPRPDRSSKDPRSGPERTVSMDQVTVQELIDAGVHFGCRVSRWNPKMAPFIHGRRNLIHIIDLRETLRGVLRAQNLLYHLAAEGSTILWVGTKRQVKGVIQEAGQRTGMPVVTERWIGGTPTNFSVIRSRLKRLEELEKMEEDGSTGQLSKKLRASMRRT